MLEYLDSFRIREEDPDKGHNFKNIEDNNISLDYINESCNKEIIPYLLKENLPLFDFSLEGLMKKFGNKPSKSKLSSIPVPIILPTPEELERQEREREIARRRSELAARFRTSAPYDLTEEEIDRLSDEQVEPLVGRWFLFLRGNGNRFNFPESMDGQFSAMMDAAARGYVEQQYKVSTLLPLDKLWDVTRMELNDQPMGKVIQIAGGIEVPKNFPLGKVYESVPISGLRERVSPLEATALLVYGLIGKKKKNVRAAYQAFEKGKLEAARRDFQRSHLSREKVFGQIAPYLAQLQQGDPTAAEHILEHFAESVKTEEVSDLVEGVRGLFRQEGGFSHLDVKMQDGVYEDLFDNSRLMSCTFLPNGSYREATIGYHNDPDVGLLHASPRDIDRRLDPVGVSILLNATDGSGRKWLVVDSVEGGSDLERVREKLWMPAVYNGIVGVARDVDAANILFNSKVCNGRPKQFVKYVSKRHPHTTVNLKKSGVGDYSHLGLSSSASREAFETWGESGREGEAKGYVWGVTR
jgi:hypothetical protein